MSKTLVWKFSLIAVLVIVAVWTLYPPDKTLKPGIDLAGGTSLIYEIDTQGLTPQEKTDLSGRMITILRRRIDPANIQNLIWRPQGNTRFEIQMPLASAEARQKRQDYESVLNNLMAENINPAVIIRSLAKPEADQTKDFERFAKGSAERTKILTDLAAIYDERNSLQQQRDELADKLKPKEQQITAAKLDTEQVRANAGVWMNLDDKQLKEALKEFIGSEENIGLLTEYVKLYADWSKVADQLTNPETGKNLKYKNALALLDKFNLTEEQINFVLEMPPDSLKRTEAMQKLKSEFPERAEKIDKVVAAYDLYSPFRGRLDDPKDLQRMLKGAGILEFRILPIIGQAGIDADEMARYVEKLKTKGPKYASDNNYVWCEIENIEEWHNTNTVMAQFGDKYYVLASNKKDEYMIKTGTETNWKLTGARPTQDQQGRRAVGFSFDERGGSIFGRITGKNIGRPLCILLDGTAISAPNIQSRITTSGIITGSFTQTQILDMVNKLNAGSLPARLVEQPISVKTIGPSIGADNRNKGILSGFIGLIGVLSCMVAYYLVGGAIADAALLMNLLFTLALMATLRATFTLPGIAGTILTIGMSVDANVLIFERIREEQMKGASLRIAIRNGYEKAFSAIFDSNLTTVLSAAILYWVASEEIKGFAIVLMLGLASSMFTALFVTRTIFDFLLDKKILKDRLAMMHLIRRPNINWMSFRPVFFTFSAILTIGGLIVFFTRDDAKSNRYDIEFTGGTSVQINLKDNLNLSRQDVEDRIHKIGQQLKNDALAAANVYSVGKSGKEYEITTTATNKTSATITLPPNSGRTPASVTNAIKKAQLEFDSRLSNLSVTGQNPDEFVVTTSQLNKSLVEEVLKSAFPNAKVSPPVVDDVVTNAVLKAFENELAIEQNLHPEIISAEKISERLADSSPELAEFLGGVKLEVRIATAATADEINQRINNLRFKPGTQNITWYSFKVLNADLTILERSKPLTSFAYVSADPEAAFREFSEDEWNQFVGNEKGKISAAIATESSLPRVTQIDPSVGEESKTRALVAIVLALIAMLIYIWLRFGNLRYGFGAIVTLAHDVSATLGVFAACYYISKTAFGQAILIGDFKINLEIVAAFLTLVGYSINDTIVIYDRIREHHRHKAVPLTPQLINDSINDTLSRTLLTGTTTLLVLFVMYIFSGKGLRGFNFTMLFGVILGTYSSIAISAPVLLFHSKLQKERQAPPAK